MNKRRFLVPALIICMLFGAVSLASEFEYSLKMNNVRKEYIPAEGHFSSVEYNGTSRVTKYTKETSYFLIYEFTAGGVTYTAKTDYATTDIPGEWDVRTVWYNPADPSEAVVEKKTSVSSGIWYSALFILIPGGILSGIAFRRRNAGRTRT